LSEYRIFETDEFRRSLSKLSGSDVDFLRKKLLSHVYPQLRRAPYFGPNIRKLRGYDPETWRYRIGRFRVFFLVDEDEEIVFILTMDPRKDAYR
jgi:mRNA interferase RelE/StbE